MEIEVTVGIDGDEREYHDIEIPWLHEQRSSRNDRIINPNTTMSLLNDLLYTVFKRTSRAGEGSKKDYRVRCHETVIAA